MPNTDFVPCLHGYDFVNDFTNHVGPITTRGLCGGMAYSALDYFNAGIQIPVTSLPAEGTPLRNFIFARQLDSLVSQGPGFISRLASLWNDDRARFLWGVEDQHELGRLRRSIDAGRPAPLGVISVRPDVFAHHQMVAIGYDVGGRVEDIRIRVYDPNHPNVVTTLVPEPAHNRFRAVDSEGRDLDEHWRTYFVDEGYRPAPVPSVASEGWRQAAWQWCNRCEALAFNGGTPGTCASGGRHDHSRSGNYVLFADAPHHPGQSGWRWCSKCQVLAFVGNGAGVCPAGGVHDHSRSAGYVVSVANGADAGQDGWKWCSRCQGLAYGARSPGACPAGGRHDHQGSRVYQVAHLSRSTRPTFRPCVRGSCGTAASGHADHARTDQRSAQDEHRAGGCTSSNAAAICLTSTIGGRYSVLGSMWWIITADRRSWHLREGL